MSNPQSADSSTWVVDVTADTFEQAVVERSHEVPVVVDFWASWCQPCRMLGPLLEQAVNNRNGQVVLAKVDVDSNQELAGAMNVSSIPAVYALRDGQVIDQFVGVLPEDQLAAWLDSLQPSEAEKLIKQAYDQEASDPAAAEKLLRQVIEIEPRFDAAKISLARVLMALQQFDQSQAVIDELARRGFLEPEAEQIQSQLRLHAQGEDVGSLDTVRAEVEADPDNREKQLKLAEALAASGQSEEALELALKLVQLDRKGTGEQAKQVMLDVFRLLGDDHELTHAYRRKLAMALY